MSTPIPMSTHDTIEPDVKTEGEGSESREIMTSSKVSGNDKYKYCSAPTETAIGSDGRENPASTKNSSPEVISTNNTYGGPTTRVTTYRMSAGRWFPIAYTVREFDKSGVERNRTKTKL